MGQARDKAGAQAHTHGGMCGCAQGGLYALKNKPKEGQEASCQEMVLRSIRRVRTCIREESLRRNLREVSSDPAYCLIPKRNNSDIVQNCLPYREVFSYSSITGFPSRVK